MFFLQIGMLRQFSIQDQVEGDFTQSLKTHTHTHIQDLDANRKCPQNNSVNVQSVEQSARQKKTFHVRLILAKVTQ